MAGLLRSFTVGLAPGCELLVSMDGAPDDMAACAVAAGMDPTPPFVGKLVEAVVVVPGRATVAQQLHMGCGWCQRGLTPGNAYTALEQLQLVGHPESCSPGKVVLLCGRCAKALDDAAKEGREVTVADMPDPVGNDSSNNDSDEEG